MLINKIIILITLLFFYNISSTNISCIEDFDCDDNIWCNGVERCDISKNLCIKGINPCQLKTFNNFKIICIEELEMCKFNIKCHNDKDCNDNFHCNGIETCNLYLNLCEKSTLNSCNSNEKCDPLHNKCISLLTTTSSSNNNSTISPIIIMVFVSLLICITVFCLLFCITINIMKLPIK